MSCFGGFFRPRPQLLCFLGSDVGFFPSCRFLYETEHLFLFHSSRCGIVERFYPNVHEEGFASRSPSFFRLPLHLHLSFFSLARIYLSFAQYRGFFSLVICVSPPKPSCLPVLTGDLLQVLRILFLQTPLDSFLPRILCFPPGLASPLLAYR